MSPRSALYDGEVVHERFQPKGHRLRYRVFSMLFDLDELDALGQDLRLFAHNRRAPIAFHDRDHGARDGGPLRPWVEARMREAGVEPDGGRIELLCYPRLLGYVFNPLSVFFCHRRDGSLAVILYEVHNTHGERHTYACAVADSRAVIRQHVEKSFYVSPFIGPTATYHFRIVPPGESINIVIREENEDGLLMAASFRGARCALSDSALLRRLLRFPLMTVKIVAAIHWEALKLLAKGFRVFPHAPQSVPRAPGTHP